MDSPPFGTLLKRHRRAKHMTQEALAEVAHYSVTYIKKLEAGSRAPPPLTVDDLAQTLEVALEERAQLHAAAEAARRGAGTNLPVPPTPLIGRTREVEAISKRVRRPDVRLLTLIGPPGVGKTRLALEVAHQVVQHRCAEFGDGVFWVPLASIQDAGLVVSTIAGTLGVREAGTQSLLDAVAASIDDRKLLLALDTCEHVRGAAPQIGRLLDACPQLTVLATSRAVLELAAEHAQAIFPLAVPDPAGPLDIDALSRYEGIALFVERAQAAKPDFALTPANAAAVARLCRRLDGLPLAIVLAAARVRALPPKAMLPRLERRLEVLSSGPEDFPARHRALRAAIDWSYDHLDPDEQAVFRRLAVFRGGCTLEAAEEVCTVPEPPAATILELVVSLVDKSLLQVDDEGMRYSVLDTIHEYALERLKEHGEEDAAARRHAEYFLALAERAKPELTGPNQMVWRDRLEADHDNLRAALAWLLEHKEVEPMLRLAGALHRFWHLKTHWEEGRQWLEAALAQSREETPARAGALDGAAHLAFRQLDLERSQALLEERLALCRKLEDADGISSSLGNLALVATEQGNYERAKALSEESLRLDQDLGDPRGIAVSLSRHGMVARLQGEYDRAQSLTEESLALARQIGEVASIVISLGCLGAVFLAQGAYERAATVYREGLTLARKVDLTVSIPYCLEGLAVVLAAQGRMENAARLLGAAESVRTAISAPCEPKENVVPEQVERAARADGAAWEQGRTMSLDQAVDYALEETSARDLRDGEDAVGEADMA